MSEMSIPHIKVIREDEEPYIVRVLNPDMVRWDRERARHRWPVAEQAPMLWTTFVAWSASKRDKHIPADMPYEAFEESTLQLQVVDAEGNPVEDDDEDALEGVDPTRGAPAPA